MEIETVMVSRKRAGWANEGLALFPDATLCIGESEVEEYRKHCGSDVKIVTHPDDVVGLGRLRQWVATHFSGEVLVQVNDDVRGLKCCVGKTGRTIRDPESIRLLVRNLAEVTKGFGLSVFSFGATADPKRTNILDPFYFTRIDCALFGMIGRPHVFDENVAQLDDLALSLQALRDDRAVVCDRRFGLVRKAQCGGTAGVVTGGNAVSRSADSLDKELAYLQKKWGGAFTIKKRATTVTTAVNVRRRQQVVV
jgi:hypothetical protein